MPFRRRNRQQRDVFAKLLAFSLSAVFRFCLFNCRRDDTNRMAGFPQRSHHLAHVNGGAFETKNGNAEIGADIGNVHKACSHRLSSASTPASHFFPVSSRAEGRRRSSASVMKNDKSSCHGAGVPAKYVSRKTSRPA